MTEIVSRTAHTMPIAEAARLLGMGVSTARRAEREGRFPVPVLREGGWLRVSRAAIDAYLGNPPQPSPGNDPMLALLRAARIAGLRAELAILEAEEPPPLRLPEVRRERKLLA